MTLLILAIASEITATLTLKAALNNPWLYVVVIIGYVATFVLLDQVLRAGMKLGVAYGLWGALGVAGTAAASAAVYGEAMNTQMVLGLAVIIAGVLCVEIGNRG